MIDPAQEQEITRVIDEVRTKSGGEIVVVTLRSLEGRPASEVALQIGREWGIGRAGRPGDPARNTGLVVLVAPNDRQVRLETGYGTNAFITAAETGRIQDQYMLPHFRQGDFGTGILLGVTALAQEYAERFGFQLTGQAAPAPQAPRTRPAGAPRGRGFSLGDLIFWIIVIWFITSFFRGGGGGGRRGRRRGWGGPVILPFPIGGGGW
ncbi:MAG TPA: TPM domain-containing protein, partial [Longimicrobiaceae bacterium]|nr:TPM domain-containing protein [Longimicrobiaceae bacterium]